MATQSEKSKAASYEHGYTDGYRDAGEDLRHRDIFTHAILAIACGLTGAGICALVFLVLK